MDETSFSLNLPKYLTTVTPFSKLLAATLFIIFPFIGFYLGIGYQRSKDNSSQFPNNSTLELNADSQTKPTPTIPVVYIRIKPTPSFAKGWSQGILESSGKTYGRGISISYPQRWYLNGGVLSNREEITGSGYEGESIPGFVKCDFDARDYNAFTEEEKIRSKEVRPGVIRITRTREGPVNKWISYSIDEGDDTYNLYLNCFSWEENLLPIIDQIAFTAQSR